MDYNRTLDRIIFVKYKTETEFAKNAIILSFIESVDGSREIVLPYKGDSADKYRELSGSHPSIFAQVAINAHATVMGSMLTYDVNTSRPEAFKMAIEALS